MKKKVYSSVGKVKCSSCGNYHYEWWMVSHKEKLSQKIGCSSYVSLNTTKNYCQIDCAYGSGYDGLRFKIVSDFILSNKHKTPIRRLIEQTQLNKQPVICDKCIQRFIKKKQIINLDL